MAEKVIQKNTSGIAERKRRQMLKYSKIKDGAFKFWNRILQQHNANDFIRLSNAYFDEIEKKLGEASATTMQIHLPDLVNDFLTPHITALGHSQLFISPLRTQTVLSL